MLLYVILNDLTFIHYGTSLPSAVFSHVCQDYLNRPRERAHEGIFLSVIPGAGPAERSPGSTSARQLASFAFPDGGGLRSALEQLTPAMPARAGGGHAHLTQPPERGGRSRDIVPDSEEEATPPDQDSRHSQPKATAGQHPDQALSQAADLDSNAPGNHYQRQSGNPGAEESQAQREEDCANTRGSLAEEAGQPAAEAIPLCTPRGTQLGASAAARDAPGSAEKERLLALAAAVPAVAAAVALMESQRGSNSPNKRKLPLSRRLPQDPADGCGSGSGSPVSQALSTHSKGGSGNREGGLAALGSQRGGLSQPSPLCPTRLNRDRPADCGSQHDAAPAAPAPQSQPPNEGGAFAARTSSVLGGEPSAGGLKEAAAVGASAAFGGEASAGGLKEAAGVAEACMEMRVRLKWLRAVRTLHKIACRRQALALTDGQTWSSSVHVPVGGESSADASDRQRSAPVPGSSSPAHASSAPHGSVGAANGATGRAWNEEGAAAAANAHNQTGPSERASSGWKTARSQGSQGSGPVSQAAWQSSQLPHNKLPEARNTGKRDREEQADGGASQAQPGADMAHAGGSSERQVAAQDGQINKRRRTDAGEGTLGSHAYKHSGHENSLKEHHAASQPSCRVGVRERDDRGELASCAVAPSDFAAREADSDVEIGGPEDLAGLTCSHRSVSQGDRLLTQVCLHYSS